MLCRKFCMTYLYVTLRTHTEVSNFGRSFACLIDWFTNTLSLSGNCSLWLLFSTQNVKTAGWKVWGRELYQGSPSLRHAMQLGNIVATSRNCNFISLIHNGALPTGLSAAQNWSLPEIFWWPLSNHHTKHFNVGNDAKVFPSSGRLNTRTHLSAASSWSFQPCSLSSQSEASFSTSLTSLFNSNSTWKWSPYES